MDPTAHRRRAYRTSTRVALVALLATACAQNNPQSLLIRGNRFISAEQNCDFAGTPTEAGPFRTRGVIDLALSDTYWVIPVVSNLLPTIESIGELPKSGRTYHLEDHNVMLTGAILNYDSAEISVGGLGVPSDLFVHSRMVVPPDSVASMAIEAIPDVVGRRLRTHESLDEIGEAAEILVNLTFEAHKQMGQLVRSNEFVYPLTICNGCLPFNPPGTSCTSLDPGPQFSCILGQDERVDCRVCMFEIGDRMICDWDFRTCVQAEQAGGLTEVEARPKCRDLLGLIRYVTPPQ